MSSNVGLSTPRGSGTSGYVQRNLSLLKPRAGGAGQPYPPPSSKDSAPRVRKPDQQILQHDRLREIEVQVLSRRDELEDDGKLDDEEIEEECDKMRERLVEELNSGRGRSGREGGKRLKGYQVHELAEAKERESERLRRALGLKKVVEKEGEEGEHPMARQERRKREMDEARDRDERGQQDQGTRGGTDDARVRSDQDEG